MRIFYLFLVVFMLFSGFVADVKASDFDKQPSNNKDAITIPENLGECFDALEQLLTQEDLEVFRNTKEEELARYHRSIGLSMRNSWGLWGGSALQDFFHKVGIFHPDDMSGIILVAFNRHLNERPVNLKELIQHYLDYWQAQGSDTAVPAPDSVIAMAEETAYKNNTPVTTDEDEILANLESTEPVVRMKAASQIGRHGITVEPDRIATLLSDEDAGVRLETVYAVGRLGGSNATQLIIQALKDDNPLVRKNAVSILYRTQDTEALASLFDDSDRGMRLNIVKILSGKEDSISLGVLVKALKDEDQEVRETAMSSLQGSRLGIKFHFAPEEFIDRLKDENPDIRMYYAEKLGKRKAVKALDPIIELLNDENDSVVFTAIHALGEMEDSRAIGPLEQLIADPGKARFADEARKAVEIIGEDKTFQDLLTIMKSGTAEERRKAVLHGLKELDDPRTVPVLIDALKDQDYWIREYAIGALEEKGDKRALEPLLAIFETHGRTTRMARALGKIGDAKAIPYLKEYLNDGYMPNRKEAAKSLNDLGWRPSGSDDKILLYFALGNYEMLSEEGEPAVDYLLTQLKDDGTRKDAVKALGKSGSDRAIAPLVSILTDTYYGHLAADSLEELGWQPDSDIERIWFWVGKGDKKNLKEHWDEVRDILTTEVQGAESKRSEFAVFTLVGVNDPKSVENLKGIFKEKDSSDLAKLYIRSGNAELVKTAQEWAERNGTSIDAETDSNVFFFYQYIQLF